MSDAHYTALIKQLIAYAKKKLPAKQSSLIEKFSKYYYAYSSPEDLAQRSIEQLAGALLSHWDLMQKRKPGEYKRRLFNPQLASDGWESRHTVFQCVLDDQPFLVDTLCAAIDRHGLTVHFIVHLGGLHVLSNKQCDIVDLSAPNTSLISAIRTAPIYIELDRQNDPDLLRQLTEDLDHVIEDARAAVADWGKITTQINTSLVEIRQSNSSLSAEEIGNTCKFLQWLLDGHFTFLGYRDYRRITRGNKVGLKLVEGSGLGVLRDTQKSKKIRYYDDLTEDAQNLALSPQHVLMLAKTNTRSTVHGSRYTDFVSVKRFNRDGKVVGESWFVGLYTSRVYSDNPNGFPIIDQKIAAILQGSHLPQQGHAYKALVHILNTLPREDLLLSSLDQLTQLAMGVLQLQERRCIRLFAQPDVFHRFISCLVYVPRDEFNMGLCQRMQTVLAIAFSAVEISYTTFFSDSVLARLHFTVRINPQKKLKFDLKNIEQALINWVLP